MQEWLDFREKIISEVGGPGKEYVWPEEANYVRHAAEEFVTSHLTAEEAEASRRTEKSRVSAGCGGIVAFCVAVGFAVESHNEWLIWILALVVGPTFALSMRLLSPTLWLRLFHILALKSLATLLDGRASLASFG